MTHWVSRGVVVLMLAVACSSRGEDGTSSSPPSNADGVSTDSTGPDAADASASEDVTSTPDPSSELPPVTSTESSANPDVPSVQLPSTDEPASSPGTEPVPVSDLPPMADDCAVDLDGDCVLTFRDPDTVCARWNEDFPTTVDVPFTADTDTCGPGTHEAAAVQDALRRINLYRWLAGVSSVELDDTLTEQAQACAVLQASNSEPISHAPPESWACYSEQGATGALGNIGSGIGSAADAVSGFIADFGDANADVLGHRSRELEPRRQTVGIGFALLERSAACTTDTFSTSDAVSDSVLAWPPPGTVPAEVIAPQNNFGYAIQWSLEFDAIGASSPLLVIEESDAESNIPVRVVPRAGGVVFDLQDEVHYPSTYRVEVVNGAGQTLRYRVRLVQCGSAFESDCDVFSGACNVPGTTCYLEGIVPTCLPTGSAPPGGDCEQTNDCEPGSECWYSSNGGGTCHAYCRLTTGFADSCESRCPGDELPVYPEWDAGVCMPASP